MSWGFGYFLEPINISQKMPFYYLVKAHPSLLLAAHFILVFLLWSLSTYTTQLLNNVRRIIILSLFPPLSLDIWFSSLVSLLLHLCETEHLSWSHFQNICPKILKTCFILPLCLCLSPSVDKLHLKLTELCSSYSLCSDLIVFDHIIVPTEFLLSQLEMHLSE